MTVKAIYEAGILRLLRPLNLSDGQQIQFNIDEEILLPSAPTPDPLRAIEIVEAIAAMEIEPAGETFPGTDHDRILYGETGAR